MDLQDILMAASEHGVVFVLKEGGKLSYKVKKNALPDSLKEQIKANRDDIIAYLQAAKAKETPKTTMVLPPIQLAPRDQLLPLSFAQQRLWFIDKLSQGSNHYNVSGHFELSGVFDKAAFTRAIKALIDRHEVLRTHFVSVNDEAYQSIVEDYQLPLTCHDFTTMEDGQKSAAVMQCMQNSAAQGFQLDRDLMLRVDLIALSTNRHLVHYTIHHIASDGWSRGILERELKALYQAFAKGQNNPLAPLNIQYADYACWQRQWLQGETLQQQLDYWQTHLKDLPALHCLPVDKVRPVQQTFAANAYHHQLDSQCASQLKLLSGQYEVTLFMLMQSAFAVLLSRYSNETDIVMGTPIAGRTHQDVESLIGFFINTLVLRTDVADNPSFAELLKRNRQTLLDAFEHQHLPFERLLEAIRPERHLSYHPVVQLMFSVQKMQTNVATSPLAEPLLVTDKSSQFDLELNVQDGPDGIALRWLYNRSLFDDDSILRLLQSFEVLLRSIVTSLSQSDGMDIGQLEMLAPAEQQLLSRQWQHQAVDFPADKLNHQLFEQQAKIQPDHIAVKFEHQQLTYAELNQRANQLAAYLVENGVKRQQLVGLCLERSIEMVVAIWAVMKAGGAYVPIDPTQPAARLQYIVDDTNIAHLLTHSPVANDLDPALMGQVMVIVLDTQEHQQKIAHYDAGNLNISQQSTDLAYVIYTSGSTGQPKGVMVEHQALVNRVDWMNREYQMTNDDLVLQKTPYNFDVSVWEFVWTLCYGGTLVVAKANGHKDPEYLRELIDAQQVSLLHFVPSMLRVYLSQDFTEHFSTSVRDIFCSGEALERDLVSLFQQKAPHVRLHNLYGPTEAAIDVSYLDCSLLNSTDKVTIGQPIQNINLMVLNEQMQYCPIGAIGQLHISGVGLARGYLNLPALTAERFITHPLAGANASGVNNNSHQRCYKTGDLARYLANGQFELVGRMDQQIKIRGFRVELGEIEHHLNQCEVISEGAVALYQSQQSGQSDSGYLVAYVVSAQDYNNDSDNDNEIVDLCRRYLAAQLPDYMIPSFFVQLEQMPLTSNGKLDRKALPNPSGAQLTGQYVAPANAMEQQLANIFAQVLGLDKVSVQDSFFHLGGHSLLAIKVIGNIRQQLGHEIALKRMFECPSVSALAQSINVKNSLKNSHELAKDEFVITPLDDKSNMTLSFAQQRLWFIDQLEQGSAQYNMPGGFAIEGPFDISAFTRALTALFERHEVLRTGYFSVNGEPRARVYAVPSEHELPLSYEDLSMLPDSDKQKRVAQLAALEAATSFDLAKEFMLRIRCVKLSEQLHGILYTIHHIASDGWSIGVLQNDLNALYQAFAQGEDNPLTPLPIQYGDFAQWQRQWLQGDKLDQQLAFWQKQLRDMPALHSFPLDKPRPAEQSYSGFLCHHHLDKITTAEINALCQQHQVTQFMLLHSAFALLLARYSNEMDIVIGSPVAGRAHTEVDGLMGFFVNNLVLRTDFSDNPCFAHLLQRNKQHILTALDYQDMPFEMLLDKLDIERDLSHNPLFQIMFSVANNERGVYDVQAAERAMEQSSEEQSTNAPLTPRQVRFDLQLDVDEINGRIGFHCLYNSDLFEHASIEGLLANFEALLHSIIGVMAIPANAQCGVMQLNVLAPENKEQLLSASSKTLDTDDQMIHQLFESQVALSADAIAVSYGSQQMSYQQLNMAANRLAHYLQSQGVGPQVLVGVCVERSIEMLVAILAVLKAGGGYVPLDPDYPQDRLHYMIEDTGLKHLLTQASLVSKVSSDEQVSIILIAPDSEQMAQYPTSNPAPIRHYSDNVAYIIYTSGSTGRPKGVTLTHRGAVSLLKWAISELQSGDLAGVLASTSMCFDLSIYEFFAPLSASGQCIIVNNILAINELNHSQQVTLINTVPSAINALLDSGLLPESLRVVNLAGEPLKTELVNRIYAANDGANSEANSNLRVYDLYGPSEGTTYSTFVHRQANGPQTVGKAIANTQLYILDSEGQLMPHGAIGELYIAGVGLAQGYHHRPTLSAAQFVPNPFSQTGGQRLYRTGDLARFLANGDLAFIGRVDHQVKLRGFRIELNEIEYQLSQCEGVEQSLVMASSTATGDDNPNDSEQQRLVAYVVVDDVNLQQAQQQQTLIEDFRRQLGLFLPDYMVPSLFVLLEQMPLTANGKIDRKALKAMELPQGAEFAKQVYVAARNDDEQQLCDAFAKVLGLDEVGINDNFFHLGGHSLLATRLVSTIRQQMAIELPLKLIFTHATVAQLAQVLNQYQDKLVVPEITTAPANSDIPLSFAQQRLWIIDKMLGSVQYNQQSILALQGDFNHQALEQALTQLIKRHQVLSSYFVEIDEQPLQRVEPNPSFNLTTTSLLGLAPEQQSAEYLRLVEADSKRAFDLSADLMLRAQVIVMSQQLHILLLTTHHIASDGWSLGITTHELSQLYNAAVTGSSVNLPKLSVQYGDYAKWQRDWLQGAVLDSQLDYWQQQLAQLPVVHSLPLDHSRPNEQTFDGALFHQPLDLQLTQQIEQLCQRYDVTLFMFLHSAFSVLLARFSSENDIVMGTPVAGRTDHQVESLIGFFVNTLVLRSDLSQNPQFVQLLQQNKQMVLDAYTHQHVPFEMLVDQLQVPRNLSYSPLFQVMLALQNNQKGELNLQGLDVQQVDPAQPSSLFDLLLNVKQHDDGILVSWNYNTALFKASSIERMAASFGVLLKAILSDINTPVLSLPLLDAKMQQTQLVDWNLQPVPSTDYVQPENVLVHHLIEQQAKANGDSIAVSFKHQQLSYQQLNEQANQLAHELIARGVTADSLVGVCFERSLSLSVALLGVLKAGGAYVPLDPQYPASRLDHIIEDAAIDWVISHTDCQALSLLPTDRLMCIDEPTLSAKLAQQSDSNPQLEHVNANHLAYVIYTSGSTGKPKGVAIEHGSLISSTLSRFDAYGENPSCFALFSSYAFDSSVAGIFWTLTSGGQLALVDMAQGLDLAQFKTLLVERKVSHLLALPSVYGVILEELDDLAKGKDKATVTESVKTVIVAGEACTGDLIERHNHNSGWSHCRLINEYGPTEATVWSSFYDCSDYQQGPVPIGIRAPHATVYVLNNDLQPCPVGVVGQLYIGGSGLARGYLNNDKANRDAFINNPFADSFANSFDNGLTERRLYCTGDLVRYHSDGNLEYLGRVDHQVKIRGYRIELAEIEAQISTLNKVSSAIVLVNETSNGQQRLVAYVQAEQDEQQRRLNLDYDDVRQQLQQRLPSYMVPSIFIDIENWPLTPNGKLDRNGLPPVDDTKQRDNYRGTQNLKEKQLVEIWAKLLHHDSDTLSIDANFFELGGDSILSIQLVSRAAKVGLHFSVKDLFGAQTIAKLAKVAKEGAQVKAPQGAIKGAMTLLPIQRQFFADETDLHHFNQSFMLSVPDDFNQAALSAILAQLLEAHDALRLRFYKDANAKTNQWQATHEVFNTDMVKQAIVVKQFTQANQDTDEDIGEYINAMQRSLSPEKGQLLKAVYLIDERGQSVVKRLMLIIHHLVVDGVSWRILLEDIETLYQQWLTQTSLALPPKTSSYQQWGQFLAEYAQTESVLAEQEYWLQTLAVKVPRLADSKANTDALSEQLSQTSNNSAQLAQGRAYLKLDKAHTQALLSDCHQAYRTKINELLLAGLLLAVKQFSSARAIRMDIESHGREALTQTMDLSRTVGWFTSAYPLTLNLDDTWFDDDQNALASLINRVKQQYRSLPNNGIGYGLLSQLCADDLADKSTTNTSTFKDLPKSELIFNYLGQFDQVANNSNHFNRSNESTGQNASLNRADDHPLAINGSVTDQQLFFALNYDKRQYGEAAMNQFMDLFAASLIQVIDHCVATKQGILTPVDFPLANVTAEQLQSWQRKFAQHDDNVDRQLSKGTTAYASKNAGIEDIYPATGMQQGLLFHSLLASGSYITQTVFDYRQLNVALYQQTWQQLVQRHQILRTAFVGIDTGNIHQLVATHASIDWQQQDLSQLDSQAQSEAIEAIRLADKHTEFDLSRAPLMRMTVLDLGDDHHRVIWSHHHALLDGWCLPMVLEEIKQGYATLLNNKPQSVIERAPFRDYVAWLASQSQTQAQDYWRNQLASVRSATPLPLVKAGSVSEPGTPVYQYGIGFNQQQTADLTALAKSTHTTVNIILQAAWGLLLSKYSGEQQVVFGAITSGRPPQLPGIEQMIGLFINTLPVVMSIDPQLSVTQWLQKLHLNLVDNQNFSYLPLYEIQQLSDVSQGLFDSLVVFENYPIDSNPAQQIVVQDAPAQPVVSQNNQLQVEKIKSFEGTDYGINLQAHVRDTFFVKLEVQQQLLSEAQVAQLGRHLEQLLVQLVQNVDKCVADVLMLSSQEQHQLLTKTNRAPVAYPREVRLEQLFAQQVSQNPTATALIDHHEQYSYQQLNERANQLAHILRSEGVGVQTDSDHLKVTQHLVGLSIERSFDMVAAILAILKAGGAYVPIDPDYPESRIEFMLNDSSVGWLLTQQSLKSRFENYLTAGGLAKLICLDDPQLTQALAIDSKTDLTVTQAHQSSQAMAYIIYTSGSTGTPKGVMASHQNVNNLVHGASRYVNTDSSLRSLLASPISFDAATFELWVPLLSGGSVVCYAQEKMDIVELNHTIQSHQVNMAWLTAGLFELWVDSDGVSDSPIQTLITGGDVVSSEAVSRLYQSNPNIVVVNGYGPTECVTFASTYVIERDFDNTNGLPIGTGIANSYLYVLDSTGALAAPNSIGELYIGGDGVSLGYLNQDELSTKAFVADPYRAILDENANTSDAKMYKTGDLVRWLPCGSLAFVGRRDQQVKVRGFRVELGEIESALVGLDDVRSAIVTVNTASESQDAPLQATRSSAGQSNRKQLIAYVIAEQQHSNESELTAQIRQQLQQILPDHMMPSAIVLLPHWPLTANGKVDKAALPEPKYGFKNEHIELPQTDIEVTLRDIWANLLGIDADKLSVTANFFELGGDSILSIQTVSRAAQTGLHFSVKDLFNGPTIRLLSGLAKTGVQVEAPQGPVSGDMPLLPIAHDFFADETDLHHFNQSYLLHTPTGFNLKHLQVIVSQLYLSHDALRLSFNHADDYGRQGQKWRAKFVDFDGQMVDNTVAVINADIDDKAAIAQHCDKIQRSLSIVDGQLFKAVLFVPPQQEPEQSAAGLLLLVIHHLVVDGVSWRILLEDIETLYEQIQTNKPLKLPAKTSSYQQWGAFLEDFASNQQINDQRQYWLQSYDIAVPLLADTFANNQQTISPQGTRGSAYLQLNEQQTQALLSASHQAYRTQINELLLAGLLLGVNKFSASHSIRIDLESHGRQSLSESLDLSRTVGWFTTMYPLTLSFKPQQSMAELINGVKAQYRALPDNGIGFGLLKSLAKLEELAKLPDSELLFNYLGQLDKTTTEQRQFNSAAQSKGKEMSNARRASHALALNGGVSGGQLQFSLSYDSSRYQPQAMQQLMDNFAKALVEIVDHCVNTEVGSYCLADFPYADISEAQLAECQLESQSNGQVIEDIYPASGMQYGLLFQSLLHTGSYTTQTLFEFKQLDVELYQKSWEYMLAQHAIFRTAFIGIEQGNTQQLVYAKATMPFTLVDLSHLSGKPQLDAADKIRQADKDQGFDATVAPMMRMTVIYLGHDVHRVIWSHHHALLDGWSLPMVLDEVAACYQALAAKRVPQFAYRSPYRDYAIWLGEQDISQAKDFWREQLAGIESKTPLPLVLPADKDKPNTGINQLTLQFSGEQTAQLTALAQSCQTTVNIVVQAAWGLLLSRYSGENKVLFGAITTGRPAQLHGVEKMVGLFINSLPVVMEIAPQMPLSQWLKTLHQQLIERESYNYLPLHEIQQLTDIPQGLFDSLTMFENYPIEQSGDQDSNFIESQQAAEQAEQASESQNTQLQTEKIKSFEVRDFGINLMAFISGELKIQLEVQRHLFTEQAAMQIASHLKQLLLSMAGSAEKPLNQVQMMSEQDIDFLCQQLNPVNTDYHIDCCIHQMFERQVALTPDAIALEFEGEQLSYDELNGQSNQLAHYLLKLGIVPDSLVGLCIERSIDMMVGALAIIKAGGAYVPIDPNYPSERIEYMIEDSGITMVLSDSELMLEMPFETLKTIPIDSQMRRLLTANQPVDNLDSQALGHHPEQLVYVIYTSGSTGKPKGSLLQHRGFCNLAQAQIERFEVTQQANVLQFASISFDASVSEWAMALCSGAQLTLVSESDIRDAQFLNRFVQANGITHVTLPPAFLSALEPSCWTSVTHMVVAGELCPKATAATWSKGRKFYNAYGPSEATVCATIGELTPDLACVDIGQPMANVSVYVADEYCQLLPFGAVGELYIGGAGLARGYLNQQQLTEQKFINNPFASEANNNASANKSYNADNRLYRTGDLVRWLPNGKLVFIGRQDEQVKIRGFRVELGEIEERLIHSDKLAEALVVARQDNDDSSKRLVAYVVPTNVDDVTNQNLVSQLRRELKANLPDYMMPSIFVVLEQLPLTNNGKVDRKALPDPQDKDVQQLDYVAPRNETEAIMCQLWQEVLGIEQVGIEDNFFSLGGHSLLATLVVNKIREQLDIEVPLEDLFTYTTISDLVPVFAQYQDNMVVPPIKKVAEGQSLSLSFAQQRLWFIDKLGGGSAQYNAPIRLIVEGQFNADCFERVLVSLIERHQVLRTCFVEQQGQPCQVLKSADDFQLQQVPLEGFKVEELKAHIDRLTDLDVAKSFDLANDFMLRAQAIKVSDNETVILLNTHHIASDAFSWDIFVAELSQLYNAYIQGKPNNLTPLKLSYADYAAWQRDWLQKDVLTEQLDYWRQQLANLPQHHSLPLSYPRPPKQQYNGQSLTSRLDSALCQQLNDYCLGQDATLFMLLQTAFSVLVSRYANEPDVVMGTPVAGRVHEDIAPLMGLFVNTLVLRNQMTGDLSFNEVLANGKKHLLDAYRYQHIPFEMLVDELNPKRDLGYSPLFQIMFILQNSKSGPSEGGFEDINDVNIRPFPHQTNMIKFDLELAADEHDNGIVLDWNYNRDLFSHDTIERFADSFTILLRDMIKQPHSKIADLAILSDEHQHMLLNQWQGKQIIDKSEGLDEAKAIHHWFEKRVEQQPHAVAVSFEQSQLSYLELNQQANQLARHIMALDIESEQLVGLVFGPSLETVVAMLAILKAGAGYVPIDPQYPSSRIELMVADSAVKLIVTQSALISKLPLSQVSTLCVDDEQTVQALKELDNSNIDADEIGLTANNLAYVIYTSGSSGTPKGVMVEHRQLMSSTRARDELYQLDKPSNLILTSISFDVTSGFIFWDLCYGGCVTMAEVNQADITQVFESISVNNFNYVTIPTAMYRVFLTQTHLNLDVDLVIVGGEELDGHTCQAHFKRFANTAISNEYGPTETTIWATACKLIEPPNSVSVSIGHPLAGVECHVFDEQQQLVPIGTIGELYIGGSGVARGYLNQPLLTEQKFITHPLSTDGQRLYRTGDLVRRLNDGQLSFVGRIDDQVKIRGFRIELGEIEHRLGQCEGLDSSTVTVKSHTVSGVTSDQLVAYIVAKDDPDEAHKVDLIKDVRAHMQARLPEHMVPTYFVLLDAIPLTPNGKVDKKALPEPTDNLINAVDYVAPTSELEKQLCEIWKRVLGIKQVSINDTFFDIGGNSLLLINLHHQIVEQAKLDVSVINLFEYPTIAALVAYLEQGDDKQIDRQDALSKGKQRRQKMKRARRSR